MTPSVRQIAARYRKGQTYRQIAADLGVNDMTVRRRLAEAGLLESRRSGPPRKPVTDEQIIALRDTDDLSWRQIAADTGLSATTVRRRYAIATTGTNPWLRSSP